MFLEKRGELGLVRSCQTGAEAVKGTAKTNGIFATFKVKKLPCAHQGGKISLRTDGMHLEPCFRIYYRKAPFASAYVDLVNGSLWHVMKKRENISTYLQWYVEIPDKGSYYYKTEYFEGVWKDVVLAVKRYILPYMDAWKIIVRQQSRNKS